MLPKSHLDFVCTYEFTKKKSISLSVSSFLYKSVRCPKYSEIITCQDSSLCLCSYLYFCHLTKQSILLQAFAASKVDCFILNSLIFSPVLFSRQFSNRSCSKSRSTLHLQSGLCLCFLLSTPHVGSCTQPDTKGRAAERIFVESLPPTKELLCCSCLSRSRHLRKQIGFTTQHLRD